jgi:hypothetical protein
MTVHTLPAGGLSEDSHPLRIASECSDVALDPLQGKLLVHQTVVASGVSLGINRRMSKKTQIAEAIVDVNYD